MYQRLLTGRCCLLAFKPLFLSKVAGRTVAEDTTDIRKSEERWKA
jgi:hypothetical protein